MIQDIHPHRFDNSYRQGLIAQKTDFILYYREGKVLLLQDGADFSIPLVQDMPAGNAVSGAVYLFSLDERPCFLLVEEPAGLHTELDSEELTGLFTYQPVNIFRTMQKQELAWLVVAGHHLSTWYGQNRFCGKCGTPTHHKADERALACPSCGNLIFPRISPAVIMAVRCGDKILLGRNNSFVGGWFSLLAGYVDVGETLEETVRREVMEEVGLEVSNIRYYKSQPWPLSGSLMVGFTAEADDRQPLKVDLHELAEAAWYKRGELPAHASAVSIAGEMIERFERGEL